MSCLPRQGMINWTSSNYNKPRCFDFLHLSVGKILFGPHMQVDERNEEAKYIR